MQIFIQNKKRIRKSRYSHNTGKLIIPEIKILRDEGNNKKHCFSVCLYKEKTFEKKFPNRDFTLRYLSGIEKTKEFLEKHDSMLRIFVDEEMKNVAMEFNLGNVFLVKDTPDFPFQQHIWRYYSVLFPDEKIKSHHFRGLDNINKDDIQMLERFEQTEFDVLHAPYLSSKLKGGVMPIRGSCSVARKGIKSLANFLHTKRPIVPDGDYKKEFFNDEFFLREWYISENSKLDYFTFVDRVFPDSIFFAQIGARMKDGHKIHIEGRIDLNGPMRSNMAKGLKIKKKK